jgi:ribosomal protein L18E
VKRKLQEEAAVAEPRGQTMTDCMSRMEGQADDPGALCNWMRDEGVGFFAAGGPTDEAIETAVSDYKTREAQGSSEHGAVLRGRRKVESMTSLAEAEGVDRDTREIKCVVIREGMGNSRDRHYYGQNAIRDIAELINGSRAFVNHQTESEQRTRPEGDLRKMAGYWKDGRVVEVEGKLAVVATLVCDRSAAGDEVIAKAAHALQFAADFPDLREVYAGISINGDGEIEPREIALDDGTLVQANFVEHVTALPSADVVTRPAREGQFLRLIESMIESDNPEEVLTMKSKELKESAKRLAEAAAALTSGKMTDEAYQKVVESEAKKVAALKAAAKDAGVKEGETDDGEKKDGEKDAKEAGEGEGDDGEKKDGDEGYEGEEKREAGAAEKEGEGEDEAGRGAMEREIRYSEKMTKRESAAAFRAIEKQLAESRAANASLRKERSLTEAKKLEEAGMPADMARRLVRLPKDQRVLFEAMIHTMRESGGSAFGGTAPRALGSNTAKPGESFLKLLESRVDAEA